MASLDAAHLRPEKGSSLGERRKAEHVPWVRTQQRAPPSGTHTMRSACVQGGAHATRAENAAKEAQTCAVPVLRRRLYPATFALRSGPLPALSALLLSSQSEPRLPALSTSLRAHLRSESQLAETTPNRVFLIATCRAQRRSWRGLWPGCHGDKARGPSAVCGLHRYCTCRTENRKRTILMNESAGSNTIGAARSARKRNAICVRPPRAIGPSSPLLPAGGWARGVGASMEARGRRGML
ncbi:hypothetical protein BC628DRAFT_65864 [Trametes gibbosa]|nr:hypothetical protein BC628DRAFT_65864 [Trametes gibbosa]